MHLHWGLTITDWLINLLPVAQVSSIIHLLDRLTMHISIANPSFQRASPLVCLLYPLLLYCWPGTGEVFVKPDRQDKNRAAREQGRRGITPRKKNGISEASNSYSDINYIQPAYS